MHTRLQEGIIGFLLFVVGKENQTANFICKWGNSLMCKTVVRSALPFFFFFFWHGIPAIVINSSPPWILIVWNTFSRSFNRGYGSILNFIQIHWEIFKKPAKEILLSQTIVIFNEGQNHSNWYQTVEFRSVHHHIKFERNQFMNLQTQANVNFFLFLKTKNTQAVFPPLNIDQIR